LRRNWGRRIKVYIAQRELKERPPIEANFIDRHTVD
jgi:hypothetical protein